MAEHLLRWAAKNKMEYSAEEKERTRERKRKIKSHIIREEYG